MHPAIRTFPVTPQQFPRLPAGLSPRAAHTTDLCTPTTRRSDAPTPRRPDDPTLRPSDAPTLRPRPSNTYRKTAELEPQPQISLLAQLKRRKISRDAYLKYDLSSPLPHGQNSIIQTFDRLIGECSSTSKTTELCVYGRMYSIGIAKGT